MDWREDRIRKLRAKARSTHFPAERDAFNRKADQLEARLQRRDNSPRAQAYDDGALIFDRLGDRQTAVWCRAHAADIRSGMA